MLKDFVLIEHQFNDEIKIVPISDAHIGSTSFMEKEFKETIKYIQSNDNVYTVLVGDIIDNAIVSCKIPSAMYESAIPPAQQQEYAVKLLEPIKDKILGAVSGNHENRSEQATGTNPTYNICTELGIKHLYRKNLAIIKVNIGKREEKPRQAYTMLLHHGVGTSNSAIKKDRDFVNSFEGVDIIVTGHVHEGKCTQHMKKVVDNHNCKTYNRLVSTIICNSYLGDADYALKCMLVGTPHSMISFDLTKKKDKYVNIHIG